MNSEESNMYSNPICNAWPGKKGIRQTSTWGKVLNTYARNVQCCAWVFFKLAPFHLKCVSDNKIIPDLLSVDWTSGKKMVVTTIRNSLYPVQLVLEIFCGNIVNFKIRMYAPRLRIRSRSAFQHSRWAFQHSRWAFQHSRWAFQHSTSVLQHSRSDLLEWIIFRSDYINKQRYLE